MFLKQTTQAVPGRERFLEAAAQADRAAAAVGTEAELAETMKVLKYMEEVEISLINAELDTLATTSQRQTERLPLRDEGDDFGRIEARIPKNVFFRFCKQKNFGMEGFQSDEGMRDFSKAFPQFMVKTVSGKTTVGYRKSRVNFQRGTLNLAT